MAQQVRNELGSDYATAFCAQELRDVQSQHYSKPDPKKLMRMMKETLYPQWRAMFAKPDLRDIASRLMAERQDAKTAKLEELFL